MMCIKTFDGIFFYKISCHFQKRISGWDKYSRNENVIVRAVCCSENKYAESGEVRLIQ